MVKKEQKMWFLTIFVLYLGHQASGVINTLNASEYAKLPNVNSLDSFSRCLLEPGDVYCYVDAALVANEGNHLFHVLQEYSANTKTHFNHTLIHRGVCVSRSCRKHLSNSTDIGSAIEACLNETIYRSHGLQTRVQKDKILCTEYGEQTVLDVSDYAVAVVLFSLLALNLAATIYDLYFHDNSRNIGCNLLLSFSVPRNWRRLRRTEVDDDRISRLKCFHAYKVITIAAVVVIHSLIGVVFFTNNPDFMENIFYNPVFQFAHNGALAVQTFIVTSAFLTTYYILHYSDKVTLDWKALPKLIFLRWLRLTPVYALVLAFVATWQRYLGSGPLFKTLVEAESLQCRRYWYYNLLYVNNYVDNNIDCMVHTWYLGADMQLSVLGLAICCLASSAKVRKACIAIVFVVGLLTPAFHVLFDGVDSILIYAPEKVRYILATDPTFNLIHKRGHSSMTCYAIGMALAMIIHQLQDTNFSIVKYKKYRLVYWTLVPLMMLIVTTGRIMYADDLEVPLGVRAVYASAIKLVFGLFLAVMITGHIFKLEDAYRGVVEWPFWATLVRLSFCAYLVHFIGIRAYLGNTATVVHNFAFHSIIECLGFVFLAFLIATPLWLMVEAPLSELMRIWLFPRPKGSDLEKSKLDNTISQGLEAGKETVECKL